MTYAEWLFNKQRLQLIARRVFPSAEVDIRLERYGALVRPDYVVSLRVKQATGELAQTNQIIGQYAVHTANYDIILLEVMHRLLTQMTRYLMEDAWRKSE